MIMRYGIEKYKRKFKGNRATCGICLKPIKEDTLTFYVPISMSAIWFEKDCLLTILKSLNEYGDEGA